MLDFQQHLEGSPLYHLPHIPPHPTPRGGSQHERGCWLTVGGWCLRWAVWMHVGLGASLMVWSVCLAKRTQGQPHPVPN